MSPGFLICRTGIAQRRVIVGPGHQCSSDGLGHSAHLTRGRVMALVGQQLGNKLYKVLGGPHKISFTQEKGKVMEK